MEKYKRLISNIGDILKKEGFFKKGNTFYIKEAENWGIIDIQKSKSSTLTEVLFTINIGISSDRLREFNNEDLKHKPEIEKSHWRKRIGFLLSENRDYWWRVSNGTVLEELTAEVSRELINIAIPELSKHIADESLKIEWLGGVSNGLTDLQRYIYLTTLLKLDNDNDKLQNIIMQFKSFLIGKTFEEVGNEHIQKLILEGVK